MLAAAALAGVALCAGDLWAQKVKGKTRPATTKQLMKGLVAPNCGDVKKLLEDKEVKWEDVAVKAAVLNEAGHLLMEDGRCPDGDWAGAAKAVQEATSALLTAAEKSDAEGANAAFKKLTGEGCAGCHKAHKK